MKPSNITIPGRPLSVGDRLGPLLQEGLKRYKSNAVPYWSTLYGTHLAEEEQVDVPDEIKVARKSDWTSITGHCWMVPHDNRVTFCFLAPLSDSTILSKVRNFLLYFHKPEETEMQRGSCFNVWDWFDTGVSAYWCPGCRTPRFTPEVEEGLSKSRLEGVGKTGGSSVTLSPLIAPWRRIMYVYTVFYWRPLLMN